MKKFFFLSIFLMLSTILSVQAQNYYKDITGIWESTSYLGVGEPSIDTLIILNHEGKYGIVCTSYEYFGVTEIKRDNNLLSFIMLNTLTKSDIYILEYDCYIVDEDRIECRFKNQIGETVEDIIMRRIN